MFTRGTVTVVTATTGHRFLGRCLRSVQQQTFAMLDHLIVPDGPEYREKAHQAIRELGEIHRGVCVMPLPFATGKNRWCGHRIYGAASLLCNTEFICFLDDDNWFEPEHVQSLVAQIVAKNAQWGFSLRRIFDESGNFVARDDCHSLGSLHGSFVGDAIRLVDTSCFMLRREVAVVSAPLWYNAAPPQGRGADVAVTGFLLQSFPRCCCNLRYTVNYTAPGNLNSALSQFFLEGNRQMRKRYPGGLPWEIGPQ